MRNIYDLTLKELEEYFISINEKPFREAQVYEGLNKKRYTSFDEMTNISKELREKRWEELIFNQNVAINKLYNYVPTTEDFLNYYKDYEQLHN